MDFIVVLFLILPIFAIPIAIVLYVLMSMVIIKCANCGRVRRPVSIGALICKNCDHVKTMEDFG